MVGLRRLQLFMRKDARGDGDGMGANGPGAFHIRGSVADDPDVVRGVFPVQVPARLIERDAGHVVPIKAIIPETAEFEMMIQFVMQQLQIGPATKIAGQQPQRDIASTGQCLQHFEYAGEDLSVQFGQCQWELLKIRVQESLPVRGLVGNSVMMKQIGGDGPVRTTGRRNVVCEVRESKRGSQRAFHCPLSGTPGVQQGAVDVEEADVFHGAGLVSFPVE